MKAQQSEKSDRMAILTEMTQRESVAMRIITVVTLIYLPATFVSVELPLPILPHLV
jgi:hypothetical protein